MSVLIAFGIAVLATAVEIATRYERSTRQALLNPYALTFMLVNGLASLNSSPRFGFFA